MLELTLDAVVARLQALAPFTVCAVNDQGNPQPWFTVDVPKLLEDLVIRDEKIHIQIQTLPAHIAFWGRVESLAKHAWEAEERNYRRWRDGVILELLTPAGNDWKKPTEKALEAEYRARPEYLKWQMRIEGAESAYNASHWICEAFKAHRDMLRLAWTRITDIAQKDPRTQQTTQQYTQQNYRPNY